MESFVDDIESESVPPQVQDPREATPQEINLALADVLQSPSFRASKQSQRLLKYIVSQTLEGRDEMLKERIIGVNVFGKTLSYNTGDDPIVRVRAADTRKRLAQYYAGEGSDSAIRIEIHPGSYRPNFVMSGGQSAKGHTAEISNILSNQPEAYTSRIESSLRLPIIAVATPNFWNRKRYWLMALCTFGILSASLLWITTQKTALDLFWGPFLSNAKPVLIYMGTDAVYSLSGNYLDKYRQVHHIENDGADLYVHLPLHEKIDTDDLVPQNGTFLMGSDVAATSDLISLIARRNETYDLRWGQDIAAGDLRHGSILLIGGFNNSITLETTNQLRFVFRQGNEIRDTFSSHRKWSVAFDANGNVTDDYALISRLTNTRFGASIITASGIGQYGTEAAGDFLTNPQQIAQAVSTLPSVWNKKNMQIVIHTKIVDGVPSSVNVVDIYLW